MYEVPKGEHSDGNGGVFGESETVWVCRAISEQSVDLLHIRLLEEQLDPRVQVASLCGGRGVREDADTQEQPILSLILYIFIIMDKLEEQMFNNLILTQEHRREPYCFDKCFNSFEKEVTPVQQDCISNYSLSCRSLHQEIPGLHEAHSRQVISPTHKYILIVSNQSKYVHYQEDNIAAKAFPAAYFSCGGLSPLQIKITSFTFSSCC